MERLYSASLPMRGEWIEMVIRHPPPRPSSSLPMRGEWIEIALLSGEKP